MGERQREGKLWHAPAGEWGRHRPKPQKTAHPSRDRSQSTPACLPGLVTDLILVKKKTGELGGGGRWCCRTRLLTGRSPSPRAQPSGIGFFSDVVEQRCSCLYTDAIAARRGGAARFPAAGGCLARACPRPGRTPRQAVLTFVETVEREPHLL